MLLTIKIIEPTCFGNSSEGKTLNCNKKSEIANKIIPIGIVFACTLSHLKDSILFETTHAKAIVYTKTEICKSLK